MGRQTEPLQVNRKIAVLGFRAVGKTSLTTRFALDTFGERYDPTIENTYHKTIRFRKVHFSTDIVDTAGMDEYSRLSRNASVGVHGYLLLYSTTSAQSLRNIPAINDALLSTLGDAPTVPRVLVGTMTDLTGEREVTGEQGRAMAENLGIPFLECSGKTGENVREAFHLLIKEIENDGDLMSLTDEEGVGFCTIL